MIDLKVDARGRARNAAHCRRRGIVLPTYAQMRDPALVPASVRDELRGVGLWDVHPRNLFRTTWRNEPVDRGGLFGAVNVLEFPPELTGIRARVLALVGKWFPTGAHKVGAAISCLVPELVTGRFDPERHKAVWPSTGNYCRGGAYVSRLLGCPSIALLPEGMSRERFEWLAKMAEEVIATPGCESNVKEIFDECDRIRASRPDAVIFNQFDQTPNRLWHYAVTGPALADAFSAAAGPGDVLSLVVLSSGSAGTLGAGAYVRDRFPGSRLAVAEALQCPTLLENGFGGHRIEGIGDKHVPWIHDLRSTDAVVGVDDEAAVRLVRLFNEPAGRAALEEAGVPSGLTAKLDWVGISGAGNLAAAIKAAKYFEFDSRDVVLTVLTDSMELYASRLAELTAERGPYGQRSADRDLELLAGLGVDNVLELSQADKRRIHNLKYFTWVEQRGKDPAELRAQWEDHRAYWGSPLALADELDELIRAFNQEASP